jgi:hypothetical protein
MGILGKVQPSKPEDDFNYSPDGMVGGDIPAQPKKVSKQSDVDIMGMLGRLGAGGQLGGQQEQGNNPNGNWEYTDYDNIKEGYVPISSTYKPHKYEGPTYEPVAYESPTYEPATGLLFGEQGKSWENSIVFKETGVGKILNERGDNPSIMDEDKELKDMLFGKKEETAVDNSPNPWLQSAVSALPTPSQPHYTVPQPTSQPSMAEIMAKINVPQPEPFTMPLPPQPIQPQAPQEMPWYKANRIQPIPTQPIKRTGRPKGSKSRPPPGGPWDAGINIPKEL